jgi:hypothetical protein
MMMISLFFKLKSTKDQGNYLTLIHLKIGFTKKLHLLFESVVKPLKAYK